MQSTARINEHLHSIAQTMVELGAANSPEDVLVQIGPEWEFSGIAGQDAAAARMRQIIQKHEAAPLDLNDDSYMPPEARVKSLDKRFDNPNFANSRGVSRVRVESETSGRTNLFSDEHIADDGCGYHKVTRSFRAMNGIELASPPRTPIGVARWLNAAMDKVVHQAKSVGLERIDATASPHDETFTNSIHLHASLHAGGRNMLSANSTENPGTPSDLLICIGLACRDYLRHSLFLFARAESDYARYRPEQIIAPTKLGILPFKDYTNLGFAMIRGEGRMAQRPGGGRATRPDAGPLRFELRIPSPGAAGHPNKSAYPDQTAMPYEMVEAYLHIIANGVSMWKERELARRRGEQVPELNEASLLPDPHEAFTYPTTKTEALALFRASHDVQVYWGSRVADLIASSDQLDAINAMDRSASAAEKGPQVKRTLSRF